MIVLAIIATVAAVVWALMVLFANGMRSSPGEFQAGGTVLVAAGISAVFWLAWWVG
jgi:hypothetical protein